jgi:lipopolysaccharide export system protein LptA
MSSQNKLLKKFVLVVLVALLAISGAAQAKTSDAEQPIHIEADQVEIRDREGLSIYRGNVHIVQGTLRIYGEEIRIHSNDQGLQKVHITGKPATFYQLTDLEEEISAQGEEMEYRAKENLLVLDRNAVLVQRDNRFTSEHIVYNTQTNVVKAGTDKETDTKTPPRVTITIMPGKTAEQAVPAEGGASASPNLPETEQK